jgi:archaellum biogenesis ATPase FlaH
VATEKNSVRPSPPEKVALAVEHFISVGQNAVVLLDGFEYLVAHNDFSSVLALLHDLNEIVALHEAILLVPMDPSTFQDREFALIRREVALLGPLATEFNEAVPIRA